MSTPILARTAHKPNCPWLNGYNCTCNGAPTEMASLRTIKEGIQLSIEQQAEIKQRLAAIEQGQGVIVERLDALEKRLEQGLNCWNNAASQYNENLAGVRSDLKQIKGELLHQQFKSGAKPKPRRKR